MATKREIVGYLPNPGYELYAVTTRYLKPESFVPEHILSDFYTALVEAGAELIATGKRDVPLYEMHLVVALARVRYTDDDDYTWMRVEPLLLDDVHSDAEDEVSVIADDVLWSIFPSRSAAELVLDRKNGTYEATFEIAKKVKNTQ